MNINHEFEVPENLADLSLSQRRKRACNIVATGLIDAIEASTRADKRGDREFGDQIIDGFYKKVDESGDPYQIAALDNSLDKLIKVLESLPIEQKTP